jgi:hypothetical protein
MKKRQLLSIIFVFSLIFVGCFAGDKNPSARIEGRAERLGQSNQESIRVHIPGTSRISYTNARGEFVLDNVEAGTQEIVFEAEGYTPHRMEVRLAAGQTVNLATPVQLRPPASSFNEGGITGTAQSSGEQEDQSGTLVLAIGDNLTRNTVTESDGSFTVGELPEGNYQIYLVRPGYGPVEKQVQVENSKISDLGRLQLNSIEVAGQTASNNQTRESTSVNGTVRLADETRHGGIIVSLEGTSFVGVTAANGKFQLSRVPPGEYTLSMQKSGYKTQTLPLRVSGDELEPVTATLQPVQYEIGGGTGAVRGYIDFEGGAVSDLSGVRMTLRGPSVYETSTQVSGLYQFDSVQPGIYVLTAESEGYEPYELLGVGVGAGKTKELPLLELEPITEAPEEDANGGKISGTALLEGKNNHQGILVKLEGTNLMTTTDAEGNYDFFEVPTGLYTLSFSHSGYQPDSFESITLFSGQEITLGAVTLQPDVEQPYVLSTSPNDGASSVPVRRFIDVLVVFSDRMDAGSVKSAIKVEPQVAHRVFFGGEHPAANNDRALIRFYKEETPTIQFNQDYTITVAETAQSLMGVGMEQPYVFSFETSGPLIVGHWPADGAEDIFLTYDDRIMIDFNDRVDYSSLRQDLKISPRPDSEPIIFPERVPEGSRVKIEVTLRGDTRYEVTVQRGAQTVDGEGFDNTPYSFSFRTGSIENEPDVIDDLIFSRELDY